MKNRKRWLAALVCLVLIVGGIVWAQYVEESWTIYSYTSNNTHVFTPRYNGTYNWSCVHHTGYYDFAIRNSIGTLLVWVNDLDHDTSGTVVLTSGTNHVMGTDEGSQSEPGHAMCNINNYNMGGSKPSGP